ncbi:ABC transporter permease [Streptacidiphilus carbonis]|uniref:ABC transporter permease n=1 Tax=Streptacidiphilus carbonis TaxID=105422 RepID=UPI0009FF74FC|nr:ABC transporter permease [Streptacidiphilus carbonis]
MIPRTWRARRPWRARAAGATRSAVPHSRLSLVDLLAEALSGLIQRPGRSTLTLLGTVLGVGAFVAVLGLTSTAAGQIGHSFSLLQDTTVNVADVGPPPAAEADTNRGPMDFPADADARVGRLNGALAAGVYWPAPFQQPRVSASADPSGAAAGQGLSVYAMSPGALQAVQATVSAGVLYNDFHQQRDLRVAVLGAAAAQRLGITRLDAQPAVFVNGTGFTVIGIISDTQRLPQSLLGVLVPSSTAQHLWGNPLQGDAFKARMVIATRTGAADLIAHQAAMALRPDDPSLLSAAAPPDPASLRDAVAGDLTGLFLLLAAICLVIGAVGIANTTLVAVLERTGEIGLRRSLGARPRHIAAQFLTESTVLGTLGGLIGTALGVATVVLVAVGRDWTAVLQPWTVVPAPFAGSVVGLLAGLYPSLRAAWVEPAEALRR